MRWLRRSIVMPATPARVAMAMVAMAVALAAAATASAGGERANRAV